MRYDSHDERVTAQIATAKDKATLAETAWLILQGGPISTEERRQAKRAIRSAEHSLLQIHNDPIMRPERKAEVAAELARARSLVAAIKQPPKHGLLSPSRTGRACAGN